MEKGRLEAFSDGVIAIIITIMVLEMKVPHGATFADLTTVIPVFLSYTLSFAYVGIYWNNHHHMLQAATKVNGFILWANLHLLFWLSLIPFATDWMGANHFAPQPVALYGVALLMPAMAYYILVRGFIASEGKDSPLARVIGRDFKGILSVIIYIVAIASSFMNSWIALSLYVLVALIWFVPDRRIEKNFREM